MLYMNKLIAFVIDEAHCVTQWCVCMCVCVCVCVCVFVTNCVVYLSVPVHFLSNHWCCSQFVLCNPVKALYADKPEIIYYLWTNPEL